MSILGLGGKPINWANPPKPTDEVMWSKKTTGGKPVIGSFRTIAHLEHLNELAVAKFGIGISVIQGPNNSTVPASEGTHDYDACLDVWINGVSGTAQQWFFRQHGAGAYWRKPPSFGNHIHYFTLPPYIGPDVSRAYAQQGFRVGRYVDGGWSTEGRRTTSSQIEDYYEHKTALKGHAHDPSPFPKDIRATIFDLNGYVMDKRTDYHWFQPGKIDSPSSGTVIGVSKEFGSLTNRTRFVGSKATSEGGGIRERSILRGRVGGNVAHDRLAFSAAAGHAPPPRAPKARASFMKKFAAIASNFKGGDFNLPKRLAQRATGRTVVGQGVLWLALPLVNWKVVSWRAVDVGGDHRAILVNVRHRKTGVVVKFLVINAMSVSTGQKKAAQIFANGLAFNPDVVLGVECSDFRARTVDARR